MIVFVLGQSEVSLKFTVPPVNFNDNRFNVEIISWNNNVDNLRPS